MRHTTAGPVYRVETRLNSNGAWMDSGRTFHTYDDARRNIADRAQHDVFVREYRIREVTTNDNQ